MKTNFTKRYTLKVPEKYHEFMGAVRLLNKAIYGLVQAERYWNNKFYNDMTAIGSEHSKADPCVLYKVADKELEMVVVVHVDDVLAHTKDQATMKRFAAELERKFKLNDMGNTKYYIGYLITRDRKAREVKRDQRLYVKSLVQKFGEEKTSRIPASSGVPTLSKADEPQTPEKKKEM